MQSKCNQEGQEALILSAINQISKRKIYQFYLVFFLGIGYHLSNLTTLTPSLNFANPTFKCQDYSEPQTQDIACQIIQFCTPINQDNLTSKLKLYCDNRTNDRNLIQSINGVGTVLGIIVLNWLADRIGKKICIIFSLFLAAFHSYILLIGAEQQKIWLIITSQFISGFSFGAYSNLIFFLTSKYLTGALDEYVVVIYYLLGLGASQFTIALINLYSPNWHTYLLVYLIGFTIMFLMSFFVIEEDPIFLFNSHQIDNLVILIQKIGLINKATVPQIQNAVDQINFINKYRSEESPYIRQLIPREIFTFKILQLIIIMALCSSIYNGVYTGMGYSIQKCNFDITDTYLLFGGAETLSYISIIILMPYCPSIPIVLSSSIIVCIGACFTFSASSSILLQKLSLLAIRFFISFYGSFYVTYYVNNLPKRIQGSSVGLIEALGNIGKIAAPIIVRVSGQFDVSQMLVFGVLSFIIGFLPLFFLGTTTRQSQLSIGNQIKEYNDLHT